MQLYPAIDLKDGKCVRLLRGKMDQDTVFNDDPVDQAGLFCQSMCQWLHIVDLNGAFEGQPVNTKAVEGILKVCQGQAKVQLGGGIRDNQTIDHWLDQGVERVILGTVALKNPDLVKGACVRWPGRIAVGVDGWDGYVATQGWADVSTSKVEDVAKMFEDCGVSALIFTDIKQDGALEGVNIQATEKLAEHVSIPVIASGGVSCLDDLRKIKACGSSGIEGVIVGRALYEGCFDIPQAQEILGA